MPDHFISIEQAQNDLLSAAAYLGERIKSGDGHAEAMTAVLPYFLESGQVDLAAELANSVEDPFSRDRLLTRVAAKCAQLDDYDYAIQLAEAIDDHGVRAQALERIALMSASKGETDRARDIADSMIHPDFVYAGIAVNQAISGDKGAAEATLDDIDFPAARVSAVEQIATTLIEKEDIGQAVDWLNKGSESANEIEHPEERARAFCDLGALFVDAKRNDLAIAAYDKAREQAEQIENIHRDFFLGSCAIGFLDAGSAELAEKTLDLVTDKTQMASALVAFARTAWKRDEKDEALDTLDESWEIVRSQRESEIRDSRARNRLMTTIAVQFAGFGKTDQGLDAAHENNDPAEKTDALSQIAQILATQEKNDLARSTINEIGDDADRLFALIALSDTYSRLDDADGSIELLKEAASLSDAVQQLAARASLLCELSARFARIGDLTKARELFREDLEVVAEIRDESSQAAALAQIAQVHMDAKMAIDDDERRLLPRILRS